MVRHLTNRLKDGQAEIAKNAIDRQTGRQTVCIKISQKNVMLNTHVDTMCISRWAHLWTHKAACPNLQTPPCWNDIPRRRERTLKLRLSNSFKTKRQVSTRCLVPYSTQREKTVQKCCSLVSKHYETSGTRDMPFHRFTGMFMAVKGQFIQKWFHHLLTLMSSFYHGT